ncbi:hypothetical protein N0V84_001201 [Fusarium piperis]|uniref:Uncharacterized protein n=1 Tax=Fusarium piperis TaxID=1435070 RepID=A0A9W8WLP6_9HYPO|nr:hypothetical protein N0V84_001201 [Fusarium piperis]
MASSFYECSSSSDSTPSHPGSRRSSFTSPQQFSGGLPTPNSSPLTSHNCPPAPSNRPPTPSSCHHSPDLHDTPGQPLTDAQLIATFTPQEQEFYNWFLETEEEQNDLMDLIFDPGAYDRFHEAAWPDPKVLEAYDKWANKWLGRHTDRMFASISDEEFFEQLRNTNSIRDGDLARLCWTLNVPNIPLAILGEANFDGIFACYAVRPSSNFLYPSPPFWLTEDDIGSMNESHEIALAINLNVRTDEKGFPAVPVRQVKKQLVMKQGTSVPDSVDVDPNDPKGKTSFVFIQLGELCVFSEDWDTVRTKSRDEILDQTWQLTGFGVVAEVTSEGVPKALWVIYNTRIPTASDDGEVSRHYDQGDPMAGWVFKEHPAGSDRDSDKRFFAARITDDLNNFGPTKKLNFEIFCHSEVQIVPSIVYETEGVHVPVETADLDDEK